MSFQIWRKNFWSIFGVLVLFCSPVSGKSTFSPREIKLTKYALSRLYFHSLPFDYRSGDGGDGSFKREVSQKDLHDWAMRNDQKSLDSESFSCDLFTLLFYHPYDGKDQTEELEYRARLNEIIEIGGEISSIARFSLARRLDLAGDLHGAIREYNLASADQDLRKECLYREAEDFFKEGKISQSLEKAELVKQMPPASYETLSLLEELYEKTGDIQKAANVRKLRSEILQTAIANIPDSNLAKRAWQAKAKMLQKEMTVEH